MSVIERRRALADRIIGVLEQMPAEVRRVFILGHYHGKSVSEIATSLGIMKEEVQGLLRRGNLMIVHQVRI